MISRTDLETRLLLLRRQQTVIEERIRRAKDELAKVSVAIEESEFWLFEVAKREAAELRLVETAAAGGGGG